MQHFGIIIIFGILECLTPFLISPRGEMINLTPSLLGEGRGRGYKHNNKTVIRIVEID